MVDRWTSDSQNVAELRFALLNQYVMTPGNKRFREGLIDIASRFADYETRLTPTKANLLSDWQWTTLITLGTDREYGDPCILRYLTGVTQLCDEVGLKSKASDQDWWGYEHTHDILRTEMSARRGGHLSPIEHGLLIGMGFSIPGPLFEDLRVTLVRSLHTRKKDLLRDVTEKIDQWWDEGDVRLEANGFVPDTTRRFTEHVHWLYLHIADRKTYETIAEKLCMDSSTISKAVRQIAINLGLSMPGPGRRSSP